MLFALNIYVYYACFYYHKGLNPLGYILFFFLCMNKETTLLQFSHSLGDLEEVIKMENKIQNTMGKPMCKKKGEMQTDCGRCEISLIKKLKSFSLTKTTTIQMILQSCNIKGMAGIRSIINHVSLIGYFDNCYCYKIKSQVRVCYNFNISVAVFQFEHHSLPWGKRMVF